MCLLTFWIILLAVQKHIFTACNPISTFLLVFIYFIVKWFYIVEIGGCILISSQVISQTCKLYRCLLLFHVKNKSLHLILKVSRDWFIHSSLILLLRTPSLLGRRFSPLQVLNCKLSWISRICTFVLFLSVLQLTN